VGVAQVGEHLPPVSMRAGAQTQYCPSPKQKENYIHSKVTHHNIFFYLLIVLNDILVSFCPVLSISE
jgi:hypothetical protein